MLTSRSQFTSQTESFSVFPQETKTSNSTAYHSACPGLYQDPEASANSAQRAGSQACGIHRQHSSPGRDSGKSARTHGGPDIPPGESGL